MLFLLLMLGVSLQHLCHGFVHTTVLSRFPSSVSSPPEREHVLKSHYGVDPHLSTVIADPSVEAESLTLLAHLTLDFSGFVMSPSRSLLRLFAVLGRVFSMCADYVVDHSIHTEELMIQLFLISVTLWELLFDEEDRLHLHQHKSKK